MSQTEKTGTGLLAADATLSPGHPPFVFAGTWQRAFLAAAALVLLLTVRQVGQCPCPAGSGGGRSGPAPYATHEVVFERQRAQRDGSRTVPAGTAAASAAAPTTAAGAATAAAAGAAAGAAAATPGAADLSLAHMLLPLTNLTNLTTAMLLDAAGANMTTGEARGLVRLHQDLYCR